MRYMRPVILIVVAQLATLWPDIALAQISIPQCETLRSFPLSHVNNLVSNNKQDDILIRYFGTSLNLWESADFDRFVTAFVDCRTDDDTFFANYNRNYFQKSVREESDYLKEKYQRITSNNIANQEISRWQQEVAALLGKGQGTSLAPDELARLHQIRAEASKQFQLSGYIINDYSKVTDQVDVGLNRYEQAVAERRVREEFARDETAQDNADRIRRGKEDSEAQELIRKYGKIGPPADFLTARFRTYAGASASGDLATVIKLFDSLDGRKSWAHKGDAWILTQDYQDPQSGARNLNNFVFYDLRARQGYVWLEQVSSGRDTYPSAQLYYLVVQLLN